MMTFRRGQTRAAARAVSAVRPLPEARSAGRSGACAEALEGRLLLATHTWTGAAANDNWSTPTNWSGGAPGVSESNVIIVFNTTDPNVVQNIAGLTIHQLRFDAGSNVVLQLAQPLTLDAGNALTPDILNTSGNNLITGTNALALTGPLGASCFCDVSAGTLDLAVAVSGSDGLVKDGAGTLRLSGGISNTYPGSTTVRVGTLLLAKTAGDAIPAAGVGVVAAGAVAPTVRLEASNQINDSSTVSLTGDVLLDLDGFDEKVAGINLKAGASNVTQVMTGSGTLTLSSGGIFLNPAGAGGTVTLNGKYNLSLQCPFDVGDTPAAVDLVISAVLTGGGAFTKLGDGTLRLSGRADNTYDGTTHVDAGVLLLAKNPVVGTSNAIPGQLQIGDGIASPGGDVVRLEASDQIANIFIVFLENFATLDLDHFDEAIGDLAGLSGSTVELGTAAMPSHLTFGAGGHFETYSGDFVNRGTVTKVGGETMTFTRALNNNDLSLEATGGRLMLGNTQHISVLSISGAAIVTLTAANTAGSRVLVTQGLLILDTARLDLTNNGMIIKSSSANIASPLFLVRQYLTSGFAGGAWTGTGIRSTTATFSAGNSVGYASNEAATGGLGLTTFLGEQIPAASVLVRFTFAGDANLDGAVGPGDFNLLASHFSQTNQTWLTGDFDYDGTVGPGDFNLLASQFGKSFPPALVGGTRAAAATTSAATRPPPNDGRVLPRAVKRAAAAAAPAPTAPRIIVVPTPRPARA